MAGSPEKAGIATEGAVGMGWVPVELMDEPDDVAWTVLRLASDEAKFVTGAEIVIDGGCKA